MLHVLLVILKVIGIILLVIFLILLSLLALVLFVPVRYQIYASRKTQINAKVNISWLFHLLHIKFYFDKNGFVKSIKILGISNDRWRGFFGQAKRLFTKRKNKKSRKVKTSDKINKYRDNNTKEPQNLEALKEHQIQKTQQDTFNRKENSNREIVKEKNKKENKKSKKTPIYYLKKWYQKIINTIKTVIYKVKKIYEKILRFFKNIKDKLKEIQVLIQDEGNKQAFIMGKDQLIKVLKHIRPRKYKISLKFGTGDPALTGQITGIFGMLMPFYKKNAHIIPDFENVIFEGDLYAKGRVTLAKILYIGWKLYRDENIRRCYKMIMD